MSTLMHENERLRAALKRIVERCETFINDEADMKTASVEVLMGIAEGALSRQAELEECPVCCSDEPHTGTCGSSDPRALCNRTQAQLAPTQVVAWLSETHANGYTTQRAALSKTSLEGLRRSTQDAGARILSDEPLMTVAQHERIVAALTSTAQTEQQPVPSKPVPAIPGQWAKSLTHCWPKYLDDKDGDWCVGTADEDGRLYEVLTVEAAQYDADGESRKIAEAIVELWAFAAAPISKAAPQPEQSGLVGQVCGGDAQHNTVNVAVVGPVPWNDLPLGTPVRLLLAPALSSQGGPDAQGVPGDH